MARHAGTSVRRRHGGRLMLSRTAESVFWLARYMERMDYMARLLEVSQRMAALTLESQQTEWESALIAAGVDHAFGNRHGAVSAEAAIDYLARDPDNPSSILTCLNTARANARAVRTALTSDTWEAINTAWLEARAFGDDDFRPDRLATTLDWVKRASLHFNGAYTNTMLRSDAYFFTRLGTFVERADNTARLVDVKYHVLLPQHEQVGGLVDYHQWAALLHSVSAQRAYHWIYAGRVEPWRVAELLILHPEMPRSLRSCYDQIITYLDALAQQYHGRQGECHRLVGELHARLKYGRIEAVFRHGLHEFLTEYIDLTAKVGDEIAALYFA